MIRGPGGRLGSLFGGASLMILGPGAVRLLFRRLADDPRPGGRFGSSSVLRCGGAGCRFGLGRSRGFRRRGLGFGAGAGLAGASFGFGGAWVAVPPPFEAPIARSASASSTLEAATFASIPAAFSAARTSFELMPFAFAIS